MTGTRAPLTADVAVLGAGPVGLTAALALAQQGVSVVVFDQLAEPSTQWRASTFHPPTMEIAAHLGLIDSMLDRGLIAPRYQLRARRDVTVATFDFAGLADETPYPFRLQLEQYKFSEMLTERLAELPSPVRVAYQHRVVGVTQLGDGVEVAFEERPSIRTRWAIGADGAHSTVRASVGASFGGSSYEHAYLALSIDADLEQVLPGICEVNYIADPVEHLLLLRIPDVWRVVISVPPEVSSEEAMLDGYVAARMRVLFGDLPVPPILSRQVYRIHQRAADQFRVGRVVLSGDAAHINSPMGGMGLNSGIHDAYDLALTLGRVLLDDADESALDDWARRRRLAAIEDVQRITHDATIGLGGGVEDERKSYLDRMSAVAADPALAHRWMLESSMIASVRRHGPALDGGRSAGGPGRQRLPDEDGTVTASETAAAGPDLDR